MNCSYPPHFTMQTQINDLTRQLVAKDEEIKRLREGLRKLEFTYPGKVGGNYFCPACKNHKDISGHMSNCWLSALLKEGEK